MFTLGFTEVVVIFVLILILFGFPMALLARITKKFRRESEDMTRLKKEVRDLKEEVSRLKK